MGPARYCALSFPAGDVFLPSAGSGCFHELEFRQRLLHRRLAKLREERLENRVGDGLLRGLDAFIQLCEHGVCSRGE